MPGSEYSLLMGYESRGSISWNMNPPRGVMYGTQRIGLLLGCFDAADVGLVGLVDQDSWDQMTVQALENRQAELLVTPKNWVCIF